VQWVEINARFLIRGRELKDWAEQQSWGFWTPLRIRVLESLGALILINTMFLFVILFSGISLFHSDFLHYPTDGAGPSSGAVGISACIFIIGLVVYIVFFFHRFRAPDLKGSFGKNFGMLCRRRKDWLFPMRDLLTWYLGQVNPVTRYASSQAGQVGWFCER
jgi:hypothetical protein